MFNPIVDYVREQIAQGRRVVVFSCEDPLNTRFHRDLLALGDYLHLKTAMAAQVDPASVELGAALKGIDSWLVVGHTDGQQVCGAIFLAMQADDPPHPHLAHTVRLIRESGPLTSTLTANVEDFTRRQARRLREHLRTIRPQAGPGEIPVRAGLIRYVADTYTSELLHE